MCRILLVKSKEKINPKRLLRDFAAASKLSPALNGDMQQNGWGISYLDTESNWQVYKSISPIWKDSDKFDTFPKTNIFLAHARSASFNKSIGDISVNQPYSNQSISYVFNGDIRGVTLKQKLAGKIGAQKIFSLITKIFEVLKSENVLAEVNKILTINSKKIIAMNIGYSDKQNIYGLCRYTPNDIRPDYHRLHTYDTDKLKVICSEPILGSEMNTLTDSMTCVL